MSYAVTRVTSSRPLYYAGRDSKNKPIYTRSPYAAYEFSTKGNANRAAAQLSDIDWRLYSVDGRRALGEFDVVEAKPRAWT